MSDGITLHCPRCGEYSALKKEYDEIKVKMRSNNIDNGNWYDSHIPVYTCQKCKIKWMIEIVIKSAGKNEEEE